MKLEEGMYVRTAENGIDKFIFKAKDKDYDFYWYYFEKTKMTNPENYVLKPSYNILELVQPGDYVNGILIESIYERTDEHLLCHTFNEEIMLEITKDNLEDIVTKEQFNSEKYIVN